jgi:26S proteasome non-ATPase regulatory subunit 9
MELIEKGVHEHFARLQSTVAAPTTNGTSQPPTMPSLPVASTSQLGAPFAKVNSVVSGSPADQAGLKAEDVIRSFGSVNWLNHERLTKVAEVVQQNEGVCTCFMDCSIEMTNCLTCSLSLCSGP